jgi:NTE family protein
MALHTLNLALQGGGALGALTWGVLDRLLEEPDLTFEAITGASAGAMNAVALAHGLAEGGRDGARKSLEAFWNAVGGASQLPFTNLPEGFAPSSATFLLGMTRFFSPYQMNPFDINPLRSIVTRLFDFERLRKAAPVRLFIGATHVRRGALRVFTEHELTAEHVLASACLPTMHHAVQIDGEDYWDGGYTGNPPLYPLLYDCRATDVLIVMLLPLARAETPTTVEGIRARLSEIHFNAAFLREVRSFVLARRRARKVWWPGSLERRLRSMHMHLIETDDLVAQLSHTKPLDASLPFLLRLKEEGRARAEAWLAKSRGTIGRTSSIDVEQVFGGNGVAVSP